VLHENSLYYVMFKCLTANVDGINMIETTYSEGVSSSKPLQCDVTRYNTTRCNSQQNDTKRYKNGTKRYNTIQNDTKTVQNDTIRYKTIQNDTKRYKTCMYIR